MQGKIRVLALMLADVLAIAAVWAAVVTGYHGLWGAHYRYGVAFYVRMWPVIPAFVGINALFHLYQGNLLYPAAPLSPVEEMRRLIGSAVLTHLGAIAVIVILRQTMLDYSRFVVLMSGLLTAAFAQPMRDLVRLLLLRLGIGQIPVVILGAGALAQKTLRALARNAYVGFRPVGFFGPAGSALGALPRLGDAHAVVDEAKRLNVRILLACEDARRIGCRMRELTRWFTFIEYLPSLVAFPVYGSRTISFAGMCGVEMVNQGRMVLLRMEKELIDKTLALLAFVLLSPFFVVVPVLVKLTSPGPVFYRQKRLGKNGRTIFVWKFRSMYRDADARLAALLASDPAKKAEWEAHFKLTDDPRVTGLGRILRKTSIDEFPQLFNVFAGDMALVGPRPIVESEREYYGDAYDLFSSVKPGITGLWQSSGRSETDYAQRVALDVEYLLNWSLWMDLWILVKTVYAVVTLRGAC